MSNKPSAVHDVIIGPQDGGEPDLVITRCIQSFPNVTGGRNATIHYRCHGVESIDVQDPWEMGKSTPGSQIRLEFITGHVEYVTGVITEVDTLGR